MIEQTKPTPVPFATVSVYLVELRCGGQEEGGWHYRAGLLADDLEFKKLGSVLRDTTDADVELERSRIQSILDAEHNIGDMRHELSCSISAGRYEAVIHDGWPVPSFPEDRPIYS